MTRRAKIRVAWIAALGAVLVVADLVWALRSEGIPIPELVRLFLRPAKEVNAISLIKLAAIVGFFALCGVWVARSFPESGPRPPIRKPDAPSLGDE